MKMFKSQTEMSISFTETVVTGQIINDGKLYKNPSYAPLSFLLKMQFFITKQSIKTFQ
jgi:hypothetical protein